MGINKYYSKITRSKAMSGDNKLTLEWVKLGEGARALVFDAKTWAVYEEAAKTKGKTARQIITTAVASSLGPILIDNYSRKSDTGSL
jgi:hypothetical protein